MRQRHAPAGPPLVTVLAARQESRPVPCLALQLRFTFKMGFPRPGLMGSSPERPGDDMGGLNVPLCEPDGEAADFLN